MNNKIPKGIAILIALTILLSISTPILYTYPAADPIDWYMTVSGVLDSDLYSLYPYTAKSLKIGFSKFGEMIDNNTNVGLEYGDVDPFASPAGPLIGSIPKNRWLNGWLINITYYNILQNKWRNVWATAQFADGRVYGGPWIRVDFNKDNDTTYGLEDPRDPGYIIGNYAAGGLNYGGRKTNGTAVTDPITVLYNGPRLFVALLSTKIYDHLVYLSDDTRGDVPLVQIVITIVFNKVKKEVILLKDIKSILTEKDGLNMFIQFSNRGQIDLGTEATGYHSYFHFFTQGTALKDTVAEGKRTSYNKDWTKKQTDPAGPNSAFGGQPLATGATYDVAQAIAAGYVFWAAFWPSLSDWTIDGWPMWWRSMIASDPHDIDSLNEPKIPYYIGEWDFTLYAKEFAATQPTQFRGVTIYGVTDKHDARDSPPSLDREAQYQLDEVFNPWDLVKAVDKETKRCVEFFPGDGEWSSLTLGKSPVVAPEAWDGYCKFAERVLIEEDHILLTRSNARISEAGKWVWWPSFPYTYSISVDSNGRATLTFYKDADGKKDTIGDVPWKVEEGKTVKVLYSIVGSDYEWIVVGRDSNPVDSIGAAMVSEAFDSLKDIYVDWAGLDLKNEAPPCDTVPYLLYKFGGTSGPLADVPLRAGYYYPWDTVPKLARTALRDDWSSTVPIASSNIISIGGSWANVVTEYFSEFTPVVGGAPVGIAWKGGFIPVPCWNHAWKIDQSKTLTGGYAVISTYKDLNGTVGFLVYGWNGEDTYWVSTALYEAGIVTYNAVLKEDIKDGDKYLPLIEYLQTINPGVTAIIIKFDYTKTGPYSTDIHPVGQIVEMLGTISEKNPHVDP